MMTEAQVFSWQQLAVSISSELRAGLIERRFGPAR
jgi:hypothetical protein